MARIMSACPRQLIAFGQRLAAGWSRLGNRHSASGARAGLQDNAAGAERAVARAEPIACFASPELQPPSPAQRNVCPANPVALHQGAAWLDLMAQINHDLRTPLNAVIGFSDVMSSELLGPVGNPRYREYASDIRDSGKRLLKAAEDTLTMTNLLARTGKERPQIIPLLQAIQGAWSRFQTEARERSIRLDFGAVDPEIEIHAPAQSLHQALINLLTAALDRTVDGGQIDLIAMTEDETVRIELRIPGSAHRPRTPAGSLPFNLARAMLELQGAGLLEFSGQDGTWRAVTILDRVAQKDFFAASGAMKPWPVEQAVA